MKTTNSFEALKYYMDLTDRMVESLLESARRESDLPMHQELHALKKVASEMVGPKVAADILPKMACKAGCSHCCHVKVGVHPIEAFLIAFYIERVLPFSAKYRFLEALDTFEGNFDLDEEAWRNKITCPFLIDQTCGIYPVRPFNCAAYNSTNVQECIASFEGKSKDHDTNLSVWGYFVTLLNLLENHIETQFGLYSESIDLAGSVDYILRENPLEKVGVYERWLAGSTELDKFRFTRSQD
jgi:Fe-S-cluster containining protein